MSWFNLETLHYSLNHAQESPRVTQGAFPQLLTIHFLPAVQIGRMAESDQDVSLLGERAGGRAFKPVRAPLGTDVNRDLTTSGPFIYR